MRKNVSPKVLLGLIQLIENWRASARNDAWGKQV